MVATIVVGLDVTRIWSAECGSNTCSHNDFNVSSPGFNCTGICRQAYSFPAERLLILDVLPDRTAQVTGEGRRPFSRGNYLNRDIVNTGNYLNTVGESTKIMCMAISA